MEFIRKYSGPGVAFLFVAFIAFAVGASWSARPSSSSAIAPLVQPTETGVVPIVATLGAPAVQAPAVVSNSSATPPPATPSPTATRPPSLADQVDAAWNANDWPQVIVLLKRATPVEAGKLYSAYYNYGEVLLRGNDRRGAADQFQYALWAYPDGDEARRALSALTPTPVYVAPTATSAPVIAAYPTYDPYVTGGGGQVCADGWVSPSTGQGRCSHHGGVAGGRRRK